MNRTSKVIIALVATLSFSPVHVLKAETPKVVVINGPSRPVPVNVQNHVTTRGADNPAFQPYAQNQIQVGSPAAPNFSFDFDVPAGKRLVIELVTAGGTASSGNHVSALSISTRQPDGSFVTHELAYPSSSTDVAGDPVFNQDYPVRLYADPGAGSVHVFIAGNGSQSVHAAGISISGYLVDLP